MYEDNTIEHEGTNNSKSKKDGYINNNDTTNLLSKIYTVTIMAYLEG